MGEKEVLADFIRHSPNLNFFVCCPGNFYYKNNIGFNLDIKGFLSDLSNFLQLFIAENKDNNEILKAINLIYKPKIKVHNNYFFFYFPVDFSEEELDSLLASEKIPIKTQDNNENKNDEKHLASRLVKSLRISLPIFYSFPSGLTLGIYGHIESIFSDLHSFLLELYEDYYFAHKDQKEQKFNNLKTMTKLLGKFSADLHFPEAVLYLSDIPFTQEEIALLTS